jgi:8-hydroxy-5-deazaflavin:NADPH oxidoreductase
MNTQKSKTKVAIIGLGKIGEAIASNLIKGNHSVILASRDFDKAKSLADKLGNLAVAKETAMAIKEAEVVIPAIDFNSLKEFIETYSAALDGKIIVDVSNPIAPDGKGGFKKIVGESESAGKILARLIPKNSKLVKAFGTLGVGSLQSAAFNQPERKILFYASDSTNSNRQIEELITSSGFEPYYMGSLDQSIRIEVFGELHEFGALGKTVTRKEFKQEIVKA